jgi:hypothetical protein
MNEATSTADWMKVLESIEQSLEQSLARLPSLEAVEPAATDRSACVAASLERLDTGLARLRTCVQLANEQASAADDLLAQGIDVPKQWLASAAQARQKLASTAFPSL